MSDSKDFVLYHDVVDEHGDQYIPVVLTPTEDTREKIILCKPCIIPIVFIPGIMGTNLRKKGSKEKTWRPPNTDARGMLDAIGQLFTYANKTAIERQTDLKTDEAEVDPSGPIDEAGTGLHKRVLAARGWGALMRSSYHPFMGELQNELNRLSIYDFEKCIAELQGWAKDDAAAPPTEWGATSGEPLTREEILHAANYQFDVWAAGYVWLQSNRDSGAAVKEYIEKVVLPYYNEGKEIAVEAPDGEGEGKCRIQRRAKPMRPLAEQVIVVTHSMGGLVSRALTEIHQCDQVMGVVHGVQPATGAPATYKRLRAGFEGVEKTILGRDAADVVAVLSQAPGGLELLPTADYKDGQPWLKARDNPNSPCSLALPKNGDPYGEIYLSPDWYGLIPEANTALMNPAGGEAESTLGAREKGSDTKDPRYRLKEIIDDVKTFHEAIAKKYKEPTYVHFGAQGKRDSAKDRGGFLGTGLFASEGRYTWGDVVWQGPGASSLETDKAGIAQDDGKGGMTLNNGVRLKIADPDCPGDGTVPYYSGEAPGKAGVSMSFAHGHGNPGKHNDAFCYDHQDSYNDRRALYATMYAIIKIAQQAHWHE